MVAANRPRSFVLSGHVKQDELGEMKVAYLKDILHMDGSLVSSIEVMAEVVGSLPVMFEK